MLREDEATRIISEAVRRAGVCPKFLMDARVLEMVQRDCPILYSVSGGRDGSTAALEFDAVADALGHRGPRKAIHSNLDDSDRTNDPGTDIEWAQSLGICRDLAAHLGVELEVVRREKGGMVAQWHQRFEDAIRRFANLEMVAMVGPWSSKKWRFCTKSQKIAPISQKAVSLFPGQEIISVVGLRREESGDRAKKSISQPDENLERADGTCGVSYYPVLDYLVEDLYLAHWRHKFPMHDAYDVHGSDRVSCLFCVLANLKTMLAALANPHSHPVYRVLCALEARSTYSFQPRRWLSDLKPELLGPELRERVAWAKEAARRRKEIEKRVPKELRYVKGWPTFQPSMGQCELLAEVRVEVAELLGFKINYTTGPAVHGRYAELLALKEVREEAKRRRAARAALRAASAALVGGASPAAEPLAA